MRDTKQVQSELHAAEAHLEAKVGQLKELVDDKLETPKRVIAGIEKPIRFLRVHAAAIAAIVLGIGAVAIRAVRRRRRSSRSVR